MSAGAGRWRLVVGVVGLLVSSLAFDVHAADGDGRGVFRRRVTTSDGVPLAMYRYAPPGGGKRWPPVLLVADLGMNREVFDLRGEGLAPYLRSVGRDVFVLEPRGHGGSGVPVDWRIRDIASRDLPAAIAAVQAARGALGERVDVVAHGFSGALVVAEAAGSISAQVRRVVTICAPALAEVPNAHAERVLQHGGRLSSLALDPAGAQLFDLLFARHGKFARGRLEALRRTAFSDLSKTAAAELLGWMREGDLELGDGTTVKSRFERYTRPTLTLLAVRDNWVHLEHGAPLRELAPRAKVSVNVLSQIQLLSEDYTHLSVLQGEHAAREVFPIVLRHLSASAPGTGGTAADVTDAGEKAR